MPRGKDKEDPYDLLIRLMEVTGQLSSSGSLNRFTSAANLFFTTNGWLGPILFLSFADFTDNKYESAPFYIGSFIIWLKLVNTMFRQGRVRRLAEFLRALRDAEFAEHGGDIDEEFRKKNISFVKMLFPALNTLTVMIVVRSLAVSIGAPPEKREYPYLTYFVLDLRKYYISNFIWQTATIGIVIFNGAICYSFLVLSVNKCVMHLRVLQRMIKSEDVNIKQVIKRHILVVRVVGEANEFFTWQMVTEIGIYSIQIALESYSSLKLFNARAEVGYLRIAVSIYVVWLTLIFAYFLCVCGDKITEEGEKVFEYIYEKRWYELDVRDQKTLQIMLTFSSQGLGLSYKKLVHFNMERFSNLLNATYSYLALLSHFDI